MKRSVILLYVLSIWAVSCNNPPTKKKGAHDINSTASGHKKKSQLDNLFKGLIRDSSVVGISYTLQDSNKTLYSGFFGYSNLKSKPLITKNTRFKIASVTKPIVAALISRLIHSGKLNLNTPLAAFFPEFPNASNITIYQLLSHTSGIPDWWIGQLPEGTPTDFPMCEKPEEYLAKMKTVSIFEPGTQHAYSNSGFVLLGRIIEKVTGNNFMKHATTKLFKQAKMSNVSMTKQNNDAIGYSREVQHSESNFVIAMEVAPPFAAGGLIARPLDLVLFTNHVFNSSNTYIDTTMEMVKESVTTNGRPIGEAIYIPEGSKMPIPPKYMQVPTYGLGFSLMKHYGTDIIWHSGGISGFNCIWIYIPKNEIVFVGVSNTDNGLVSSFESILSILDPSNGQY